VISERKHDRVLVDTRVHLREGWVCDRHGASTLWFKGQMPRDGLAALHRSFQKKIPDRTEIEHIAVRLEGNFGLVLQCDGCVIAISDHCNSIPILIGHIEGSGRYVVGSSGSNLVGQLSLGPNDIAPEAALSVAMSGYTIGDDTLYPAIQMLLPGSVAEFRSGRHPKISAHHAYQPWTGQGETRLNLKASLADELGALIKRLIISADGRPITVPLSAGLDSRLIVSGLKEFGYSDVRCFSYGLKGNHEAEASRQIAEKLGYDWTFVPYSIGRQRHAFASADHNAYVSACDHLAGVHFEQEYLALRELTDCKWIPSDAIIVNGQSGDFISGNHIPTEFHGEDTAGRLSDLRNDVVNALVAKHFALWQSLATSENKKHIGRILEDTFPSTQSEGFTKYGLYEWNEFRDRQCKYVVQNIRVYEHFGFGWRMPLWDRAYMRFWEKVPLTAKTNQNLYREVLHDLDWGQVWRQIPVNKKVIRPHWLRPIRFGFKIIHAPIGRSNWHDFERQFFSYWLSNLCSHAIVPYRKVICDGRGHRSAISWWARDYLRRKGVDFGRVGERRNA
jgi:asparagine synthase (glutamine-hydrolysing)